MAYQRQAATRDVYDGGDGYERYDPSPPVAHPQTVERRPRGMGRVIEAWYGLTAPDPRRRDASLAGREVVRRGRVASVLLLGLLAIWVLYLPVNMASGYGAPALVVFAAGMLILSGLLAMNRRGWVTPVALSLILPIDAGFLAIQLTAVVQASPAERAGSFPILIFSELVAAALLMPEAVFLVAFVNCILLFVAIMTWPAATRLAMFNGSSPSALYNIVVGTPATQFIIALVMFLFTRSALNALGRADRAERLAEAQRQEEERQRRVLQDGAEHIRQVLVSVSNGNYHARVARVPHPLLWQIGATLNTFVGRLDRLEYESYTLRREGEQIQRVADAILIWRRGRQPIWPAPSGLPVDAVILALTRMEPPVGPARASPVESFMPPAAARPPGPADQPDQRPPQRRPFWDQGQASSPQAGFWPGEADDELR